MAYYFEMQCHILACDILLIFLELPLARAPEYWFVQW